MAPKIRVFQRYLCQRKHTWLELTSGTSSANLLQNCKIPTPEKYQDCAKFQSQHYSAHVGIRWTPRRHVKAVYKKRTLTKNLQDRAPMSLAKIPLIFGFSLAFKRCVTSPNPAPVKEERIHEQKTQVLESASYTQTFPKYVTRLQFLAGFAEIATIIAYQYPTSPLSKFILSLFVLEGGNPANLHLSTLTTIGGIMMITGTLIRVITYRYLGRFFRFEASIQRDHQLVTGGPYSFVRHPSYTGLVISHPGWFLWQFGRGSWVRESGLWNTVVGKAIVLAIAGPLILGMLYLTLTRMSNEDKALRKQFGAQWDRWAKGVPYSVLPGIY